MTAGSPSLGTRASLKDRRFMARGFGKAPRALSARRFFISSFLTVSKRLSIDEFPSVTGPHGSHAFGNAVIKRGFGLDQEDGEAGV